MTIDVWGKEKKISSFESLFHELLVAKKQFFDIYIHSQRFIRK